LAAIVENLEVRWLPGKLILCPVIIEYVSYMSFADANGVSENCLT